MKKILTYFIQNLVSFIFICIPVLAEEAGKVEPLKKTIDLSKLSGFNLLLAKLYNENLFLYSIVSVVLMALVGIIFATIIELIFSKLGITVEKTEHKEE